MNFLLKNPNLRFLFLLTICITITFSCTDNEIVSDASHNKVELDRIAAKLNSAGFDTSEGFIKYKDGYLVEYDIFMTEDMIDEVLSNNRVPTNGRTEHYTANNLVSVSGPTRTLYVFMDGGFGTYMQDALDNALARYNALNLNLKFQRTTFELGAQIVIHYFDGEANGILGYTTGWPSLGNPARFIFLSDYYYHNNNTRADAATTIAHEIGHAIGFRHTDYMNRRYSCGNEYDENGNLIPANEPNVGSNGNTIGENHIPGTPTVPSSNSWMLACFNNSNRPFTSSDVIALETTYFRFGNENMMVGDWNGNGIDNIGVRRGNVLFFDTNYNGGYNIRFSFGNGNSESQYIVGDWDGDGRDNIGVRRGVSS